MAKKYKIIYSDDAQEDLNGILHYYLTHYSKAAAERILVEIESRIQDITRMPEAYSLFTLKNRPFKKEYRYIFAKKTYRILYRAIIEESVIRIITISHKRADSSRLIRSIEEE